IGNIDEIDELVVVKRANRRASRIDELDRLKGEAVCVPGMMRNGGVCDRQLEDITDLCKTARGNVKYRVEVATQQTLIELETVNIVNRRKPGRREFDLWIGRSYCTGWHTA